MLFELLNHNISIETRRNTTIEKAMIDNAYQLLIEDGLAELARASRMSVRHRRKRLLRRLFGIRTVLPTTVHFKYRTWFNTQLNEIIYEHPPKPYEPISVDPVQVEYQAKEVERYEGVGKIKSGEWDKPQYLQPIEDNYILRGLKQRFVENRNWANTVYYAREKEKINRNGQTRGYTSTEEFLETRCAYVDELFGLIRDEEYRPNFEADHDVPDQDARNTTTRRISRLEPLVAIGRDGDIYWVDGFHRLAIARILELESIPVNVIARHSNWQQLRELLQTSPIDHEALDFHPDLSIQSTRHNE